MEPLTSGIQGTAVTPVKINGVRKTIAGAANTVTGFMLHQLAGFPDKLHGNGKAIEKTNDPVKFDGELDLTADYGDGKSIDHPHALESKESSPPNHPEPLLSPQVSPVASPPPSSHA